MPPSITKKGTAPKAVPFFVGRQHRNFFDRYHSADYDVDIPNKHHRKMSVYADIDEHII
jgi:hypothetical protein